MCFAVMWWEHFLDKKGTRKHLLKISHTTHYFYWGICVLESELKQAFPSTLSAPRPLAHGRKGVMNDGIYIPIQLWLSASLTLGWLYIAEGAKCRSRAEKYSRMHDLWLPHKSLPNYFIFIIALIGDLSWEQHVGFHDWFFGFIPLSHRRRHHLKVFDYCASPTNTSQS